ncbi:neprilysin-3-like [Ornithodoros turicata]|uniref:neprilysin-3-like n=1 Tax=Ornithodoros turicata TaxID=34597 RepID=UPI003139ED41
MLPPLHLARFGFLTARELLRSLVGEGASVGRRGSNTPWWSEPASSFFKKKSYCFVKQYKDYSMLEMNPFESVNENLLDNAALQVAHKVYWKTVMSKAPPLQPLSLIEWKQGEYALPSGKLFFYAYASNMCGRLSSRADYDLRMRGPFAPIEMRVNVPLMNMRAFTDAFECERDARMNPDRKCIIL